jgi:hypothetical protein
MAKIIRSSKSTTPSGGPPPALPKSPGIKAKEGVENKNKHINRIIINNRYFRFIFSYLLSIDLILLINKAFIYFLP